MSVRLFFCSVYVRLEQTKFIELSGKKNIYKELHSLFWLISLTLTARAGERRRAVFSPTAEIQKAKWPE